MHELADVVALAGVDHVAGADHGAAQVLGPAALHRRAQVDHPLGAVHRAVDGVGVAEVAEGVLDALDRLIGNAAHERAHGLALLEQPLDDRRAERARRAGDEEVGLGGDAEASQARRLVLLGLDGDLLDPVHDLGRVLDGDRRRLALGQTGVEVRDEVAQALEGLDLLAHELPRSDRHVDQRLERLGEGVDHALGRLRQRRGAAPALEHREQVDADQAARALNDHLALHRLRRSRTAGTGRGRCRPGPAHATRRRRGWDRRRGCATPRRRPRSGRAAPGSGTGSARRRRATGSRHRAGAGSGPPSYGGYSELRRMSTPTTSPMAPERTCSSGRTICGS